MKVAFDSRAASDPNGVGHHSRCLLQALRETAAEEDEIVETHRPHGADLFYTPWMQGAMLHSPCPMVVTLHDLTAVKRPSERLRCGGMHMRLRRLAVQRAVQVIVPTDALARDAVAELGLERERLVVIPDVPDPDAPAWTGKDAARATWAVYAQAVADARQTSTVGRAPRGRGGLRGAAQ